MLSRAFETPWFAWRPVWTVDAGWTWLRQVYRVPSLAKISEPPGISEIVINGHEYRKNPC